MPPAITRHFLSPTESLPLTPENNQRFRTHPHRSVSGYDDAVASLKGRNKMTGLNLLPPRANLPAGPETLFFGEGSLAKVPGYNTGPFATNTGTSVEGILCATDGLGPCSGVLLGAEPAAAAGILNAQNLPSALEPKAKVRVFHVYNFNHQAPQQVSDAITKLWSEGLVVKAAMRGGLRGDELSHNMVGALKEVLHAHAVPLVYDDTLTREECGGESSLLGGVVDANRVVFTNDVRVIPSQPFEE